MKQKTALQQPSDKIELDQKSLTMDTSARFLLQENSKAQLKEKFVSQKRLSIQPKPSNKTEFKAKKTTLPQIKSPVQINTTKSDIQLQTLYL